MHITSEVIVIVCWHRNPATRFAARIGTPSRPARRHVLVLTLPDCRIHFQSAVIEGNAFKKVNLSLEECMRCNPYAHHHECAPSVISPGGDEVNRIQGLEVVEHELVVDTAIPKRVLPFLGHVAVVFDVDASGLVRE